MDADSANENQQAQKRYTVGIKVRALVEIYPTEFGGAKSVSAQDMAPDLAALELVEAQQTLRLIHSVSQAVQEVSLNIGQEESQPVSLHRVGEMWRLPFLPPVQSRQSTRPTPTVELAAGEHLVLRFS